MTPEEALRNLLAVLDERGPIRVDEDDYICREDQQRLFDATFDAREALPQASRAAVHITTNARFQYERSEYLVAQSAADIAERFASEPVDRRQKIHEMLLERLAPVLSQNNALWEWWDEMMSGPCVSDPPGESITHGRQKWAIAAAEERRRAATAKLEGIRHKEARVRAWIPAPEPAV